MLYITVHNYSQYNHAHWHNSVWSPPYKRRGEHSILDTKSQPPYFAWSGLDDDDDDDDNNINEENNDLRKTTEGGEAKTTLTMTLNHDKNDKKYG